MGESLRERRRKRLSRQSFGALRFLSREEGAPTEALKEQTQDASFVTLSPASRKSYNTRSTKTDLSDLSLDVAGNESTERNEKSFESSTDGVGASAQNSMLGSHVVSNSIPLKRSPNLSRVADNGQVDSFENSSITSPRTSGESRNSSFEEHGEEEIKPLSLRQRIDDGFELMFSPSKWATLTIEQGDNAEEPWDASGSGKRTASVSDKGSTVSTEGTEVATNRAVDIARMRIQQMDREMEQLVSQEQPFQAHPANRPMRLGFGETYVNPSSLEAKSILSVSTFDDDATNPQSLVDAAPPQQSEVAQQRQVAASEHAVMASIPEGSVQNSRLQQHVQKQMFRGFHYSDADTWQSQSMSSSVGAAAGNPYAAEMAALRTHKFSMKSVKEGSNGSQDESPCVSPPPIVRRPIGGDSTTPDPIFCPGDSPIDDDPGDPSLIEVEDDDDDTTSLQELKERFEPSPVADEAAPEGDIRKIRAYFEAKVRSPAPATTKFETSNTSIQAAFERFESSKSNAAPMPAGSAEISRSMETSPVVETGEANKPISVAERIKAFGGAASWKKKPSGMAPEKVAAVAGHDGPPSALPTSPPPVPARTKATEPSSTYVRSQRMQQGPSGGASFMPIGSMEETHSTSSAPTSVVRSDVTRQTGSSAAEPSESEVELGNLSQDLVEDLVRAMPTLPRPTAPIPEGSSIGEDAIFVDPPSRPVADYLVDHVARPQPMSFSQPSYPSKALRTADGAVDANRNRKTFETIRKSKTTKKSKRYTFHKPKPHSRNASSVVSDDSSEDSDGVTLDLSIAEVSGITNPTALVSRAGDTLGEDDDSSSRSKTIQRTESDARKSEASSSQPSEAAAPLIARALRMSRLSDDASMGDSFFNARFNTVKRQPEWWGDEKKGDADQDATGSSDGWDTQQVETFFPQTTTSSEDVFASSNDWSLVQPDQDLGLAPFDGTNPPVHSFSAEQVSSMASTPQRENTSGKMPSMSTSVSNMAPPDSPFASPAREVPLPQQPPRAPTATKRHPTAPPPPRHPGLPMAKPAAGFTEQSTVLQRLQRVKEARVRRAAAYLHVSASQSNEDHDEQSNSTMSSTRYGGAAFFAALEVD